MKSPTLATGCPVDLPRLIETRLLVQANSGGGKSWALRRLLEQTAPHVQQFVLDPEGEFASLREKFDYIVCAPEDGDAVAHPRTAKLLARRLLETGVSAVLDIYDLKPRERKEFVRIFCEALVNAPKRLWHPALVVLDEAHVFAPEKGGSGSLGAVIDLATRGRKRGYCLVAATQRLSKLHKDVAAELNNKMIGRTGLDNDVKRAADELGMTKPEAMKILRFLDAGEWYVYGPALSRSVRKIKVGPVKTTHPKIGERLISTPPAPSKKVKRILAELGDLPQQAAKEAQTIEELKRAMADLQRQLRTAQKQAASAGISEAEVQRRIREAVVAVPIVEPVDLSELRTSLQETTAALQGTVAVLAQLEAQPQKPAKPVAIAQSRSAPAPPPDRFIRETETVALPVMSHLNRGSDTTAKLGKGESKVLVSIAQHEDGVDRELITILTGYKRSTRDAYIQRLNAAFMIDVGPPITVTEIGLSALPPDFKPLPTGAALREHWLATLPQGERTVLEMLVNSHPHGVERDQITEITEYKRSTRDAYIQRLRTRKLIAVRGRSVFAHNQLFVESS